MLCLAGASAHTCWSMAAPGSGSFNSLTRRHGVKIDSAASVENYGLAVGEEIGHDNVLSASRMNGAIVVVAKTVDLANQLGQNGIKCWSFCLRVLEK